MEEKIDRTMRREEYKNIRRRKKEYTDKTHRRRLGAEFGGTEKVSAHDKTENKYR